MAKIDSFQLDGLKQYIDTAADLTIDCSAEICKLEIALDHLAAEPERGRSKSRFEVANLL